MNAKYLAACLVLQTGLCLGQDFALTESPITFESPIQELQSSFGHSIDVSEDTTRMVVGAPKSPPEDNDERETGKAYLYDLVENKLISELTLPKYRGRIQLGASCKINDRFVAVGAPWEYYNEAVSGAVYIFDASNGEYLRTILPADGQAGALFGSNIELQDKLLLVGAERDGEYMAGPGSAYLFDIESGEQLHKFVPSDSKPKMSFGNSAVLTSKYACIGAEDDNTNGESAGAVYIFDLATGQQIHKITAEDKDDYAGFGRCIATNEDHLYVSARCDVEDVNVGAVYIFSLDDFSQIRKVISPSPFSSDFGSSISTFDQFLVVGAPYDYNNGDRNGSVYVYDLEGNLIRHISIRQSKSGQQVGRSVSLSKMGLAIGATARTNNSTQGTVWYYSLVAELSETE